MVSSALAFACGRFTSTPTLSSGAVTMKMMSSTSITSMYGTTLISDLSLRRLRWIAIPAMEDSGQPAGAWRCRMELSSSAKLS